MCQLGRLQDMPPIVDLLKDVEYFKDQALCESKYEQFWKHATKLGVDTLKESLDNLGHTHMRSGFNLSLRVSVNPNQRSLEGEYRKNA